LISRKGKQRWQRKSIRFVKNPRLQKSFYIPTRQGGKGKLEEGGKSFGEKTPRKKKRAGKGKGKAGKKTVTGLKGYGNDNRWPGCGWVGGENLKEIRTERRTCKQENSKGAQDARTVKRRQQKKKKR